MNLWLQAGKLLIDSAGRLILCDECPCVEDVTGTGTGTGTFVEETCGNCVLNPHRWTLTVAGIGGASQCGIRFNGTHILEHLDRPCTPNDVPPVSLGNAECCWGKLIEPDFPFEVGLFYNITTQKFTLEFYRLTVREARYEVAKDDWNCLSSNVMSGGTTGGNCSGWPATMTVTPI